MTQIRRFVDYTNDHMLYIVKDGLVVILMLAIMIGIISSFLESEQILAGTAPTQTIYIQKTWAEQCGLTGTCYYVATESQSMRLQPGVWFGTTTDRDLFVQVQQGYNCAVITSGAIRQIQSGRCP